MTVYFLSGLGADERMFQKLVLPETWTIHHMLWLSPLPKESLSSYCCRLSENINTDENFVLVGLSFGGIVAVELNKIIKPKLTILISSIATKNELPAIAHLFAKTKLDILIPAWLLKIPNAFTYWFFGTNTLEEKHLVRQSITNTSSRFLKWAMHEIVNWKNELRPDYLVHIQGSKDRLLPAENTNADIIIKGGGHIMVYSKADEISRILIEKIGESL